LNLVALRRAGNTGARSELLQAKADLKDFQQLTSRNLELRLEDMSAQMKKNQHKTLQLLKDQLDSIEQVTELEKRTEHSQYQELFLKFENGEFQDKMETIQAIKYIFINPEKKQIKRNDE